VEFLDGKERANFRVAWKQGLRGCCRAKKRQRQETRRPGSVKKQTLGALDALALFTFSSVLMVFSGIALFAFLFAVFAVIFG